MKQYNHFEALYRSFYDAAIYRDVAKNWQGIGFWYLVLVIAIFSVPWLWMIDSYFNQEIHTTVLDKLTRQIPTITVKDGVAHMKKPSPQFIYNNAGRKLVIIDMSGKYKNLADQEAYVLVTPHKVILARPDGHDMVYFIKTFPNTVLTQSSIRALLDNLLTGAFILLTVSYLLAYPAFRLAMGFFYALIGKLFTLSLRVTLSLKQLMRLTSVAVTPMLTLDILFFTVFYLSGWFLFFTMFVTLGYLFFAVRANRQST